MRKVVTFVRTAAAFGRVTVAASAGTIELRGVYSMSVVGADCVHALNAHPRHTDVQHEPAPPIQFSLSSPSMKRNSRGAMSCR
jgi:hypothetical protein